MFTADGFFWVLLIVVVAFGMKWHTYAKMREIVKDGGFTFKGKYYDVYYLGRADRPECGMPEALRDPDNGAFAPNTLEKIKSMSEDDRQTLCTMKDDLALCSKYTPSSKNMPN